MKKILFCCLLLLGLVFIGCQSKNNSEDAFFEEIDVEESEINDENTFFKKGKAILQSDKGNIDEAIELFNKAIEIKPDADWIIGDLGRAKARNNDLSGAIECYTKAIELNNKRSVYYDWRAESYRQLGKEDLAEKDQKIADELHAKGMD